MMAGRMAGKVALVTGGGGGIGGAVGRLFCAEEAGVALVDVDGDSAQKAARAIADAVPGARLLSITADVSREEEAIRAVAETVEGFGRMNVLINNAAVREYYSLAEAPADSWERILAVNLRAAHNCSKAALPFLRQAQGASVVNLSSAYALLGRKGMGQYDATKAAILALTRVLAHEEAEYGIRVNAVCPGSTLTPWTIARAEARGLDAKELTTMLLENSLLGRWARPEEIAYPILWLASDEASFITGSTLVVDGGLSIK